MSPGATAVRPPAPRRSQAERRADSRRRLLSAAIDCLAEDGYARTTLASVLARAGLSNGAMWRHFPTKAELFTASVAEMRDLASDEETVQSLAGLADAERLDALVARLCAFAYSAAGQATVELLRASRTDPELRAALAATDHALAARFFDTVRAWVGPRLADRPDFEVDARWLGLAVYGLAVTRGPQVGAAPDRDITELQHIARRVFGLT